jgi:hypothetical protein
MALAGKPAANREQINGDKAVFLGQGGELKIYCCGRQPGWAQRVEQ